MTQQKVKPMFSKYLSQFSLGKGEGKGQYTHTRIPDSKLKISGGTYRIPEVETETFMEKYYKHVFVNGNPEFLTEKHLVENGPVLIDIDERYDKDVTERQHSEEDIATFVQTYMDILKDVLVIPHDTSITVYIQQRPCVTLEDTVTKDGVHLLIGVALHKASQLVIRRKMMDEIREGRLWSELREQQTNTPEDLFDEAIAKGSSNWPMYGSMKPGKKPYLVTRILKYVFCEAENEWDVFEEDIKDVNWEQEFPKLSARYSEHPSFEISDDYAEEIEKQKDAMTARKAPVIQAPQKTMLLPGVISTSMFGTIDSADMLDALIERCFDVEDRRNYVLKETHDYTMLLTEEYYGPQSYVNWMKVGWALFNTNKQIMFLTWLKMSSQEGCRNTLRDPITGEFDWMKVPELWDTWSGFYADERSDNKLTERSIRYWAQKCNPEGYEKVRHDTLDYFIEETLREGPATATEYDLANVLLYLFKDRFVCVGLKSKTWFEFINHRWIEIDSATTLRVAISKDMHDIYMSKTREAINAMHTIDHSDERWAKLQKRSHKLSEICIMLKTTCKKDNIMKEASHLFYDSRFYTSLNSNTHLLCFNNGVYDFNEGAFRKGLPEDYISKTTEIAYIPYEQVLKMPEYAQVNDFLDQLFPDPELRRYQMDWLSSLPVGGNENHQMSFWLGTGANGKTALVTLLEKAFGQYKGTVPVTLVTRERLNIGTASPEVAALAGVRLAVMQETSKGDKINEGPMKDLTGGDPITARALYKDSVTFRPQFKMVLCTNILPEIQSQDDGTWRRIMVVDFESKFHRKPFADEVRFPKDQYPYQFPIDTKLDKKFDKWAPVLMSIMIERYKQTKGEVVPCERVIASNDKYREGQDYFLEFVKENIEPCEGSRLQKAAIGPKFRFWFKDNHGTGMPKSKDLWDFMEKRYGRYKAGWNSIRFIEHSVDTVEAIQQEQ
jgi:P4 family phage/plasmid primase-like protien